MTSLVYTLTETLRYRGAVGQWSWVMHRLTGLGVVFFVVLHIIDTSWAAFYPELYVRAIAEYQSPLFTIGEFGLVFAVVYHALNGLRIAIIDFNPEWWKYQRRAALYVVLGTIIILVPTFWIMFGHVLRHYAENPQSLPLVDVILGQVRFVVGMIVAFVVALILSGIYGAIAGQNTPMVRGKAARRLETFWWSYMRISGIIIVPLVFGHLAMMHLVQGVFDITAANFGAVGAVGTGLNVTGTSVEFVADRWNTLVAGVAVWRLYDAGLLLLVVVHGFNGLRYVFTDYVRNPLVKRALVYLCVIAAVVLLVVGSAALIKSVDETAIEMGVAAMENLHPEGEVAP